jgi:hypothetical protein
MPSTETELRDAALKVSARDPLGDRRYRTKASASATDSRYCHGRGGGTDIYVVSDHPRLYRRWNCWFPTIAQLSGGSLAPPS